MKKIEKYNLPEHTNNLYRNEAISSIGLTHEIANKINEIIETLNEFSETDLAWKHEQEGTIRKGVLYMKDNLLNSINEILKLYGEDETIKNLMLTMYQELLEKTNAPVTPQMFGAKGDGVTDDTYSILSALEHCYNTGATLELLNCVYMVRDITITDSVTFNFNGGTLKRIPETVSNYYVVNVEGNNVVLNNPHLVGDRLEHIGDGGEWGHCLRIGGENVTVNNGYYEYAWGDGVYIYGANAVKLNGVHHTYKCSRNGVSIVKGAHIDIDTLISEHTDRTAPMYAVDIEANNSDEETSYIHINNIISKYNEKALGVVCRGNKINDVTVDSITSIESKSSPLAFSYSEINDKLGSPLNSKSIVYVGKVLIDKSIGCGVVFGRWNKERCPFVSIDEINIINFEKTEETISNGLVGLMVDRNYTHIINYGNFNVTANAQNFDNLNVAVFLNRQNEGYKEDAFINDVAITSFTSGLLNPNISFNNITDVFFNYNTFANDETNLVNGFNYVTVTKPSIRTWLKEFTMYIGVSYITLDIHNTFKGKVFINDAEYDGKVLYNMKDKVIHGIRKGENLHLYFDQTSKVWATTNTSSQKEPTDGQTIFATSVKKPAWYYDGVWYFADGTVYNG